MQRLLLIVLAISISVSAAFAAEEPVFSGPQVGEKLTPFAVKGVFDGEAGKESDFIKQADGSPTLLIFVHEFNRPSVAVTRVLMDYAATRRKDGLFSAIVKLSDDFTATSELLNRARHALPKKTPVAVSVDGREGPGAYGLNRNVTLTILVAKDNRVTANFALVQPSIQADVLPVLEAVVKQVGGDTPKLADLNIPGYRAMAGRDATDRGNADETLVGLLRQLIQKDADEATVKRVGGAIEKHVADKPAGKRDIGERAKRVVDGGKLENYGTKPAQEYLKKWAKEFAPPGKQKKLEPESR